MSKYGSTAFTYDTIGNTLTDGTWTYTWERGRQLKSMSNGSTTWNMTYDPDGLRTSRTDGTNTYYYYYSDGLLTYMKYNSLVMRFTYDAQGNPVSMTYNGNIYFYVLNLQGDVMALLDSSGNEVVSYHYNAWGKLLNTTASTTGMLYSLALYNPLRYRGYVYDRETGLYYLQSRYYNPEICRFISADNVELLGANGDVVSYNLFAYCGNNPVSRTDPTGKDFWDWVESGWNTVCNFFNDAYNYIANPDEQVVLENLENNGFSFYKGVPVFSSDWLGTSALSFGVIVMGSGNLKRRDFDKTLNHEYGHSRHLAMIGPVDYLFTTAVPSLVFAGLTNEGLFPYEHYHDLPWERTADYLGGVEYEYLPTTNTTASLFWLYTLLYAGTTLY